MSEQRISDAMDRIDRALGRIETQAALARHPSPVGDTDLVREHSALRKSVEISLAELDQLIEQLER